MVNPKIRVIEDILLSISFIVASITGLILKFGLERGIPRQSFLSIERHTWILIHDYSGIALIILTMLHFIFYWNIVKCAPKILARKKK